MFNSASPNLERDLTMIKKVKVKDLQRHYYTDDDRFYTTKEIMKKPIIDGEWIPYNEYIKVLIQLVKLKNKSLSISQKAKEHNSD